MTPAQRLRSVLEPQFLKLLPILIRTFCKKHHIKPDHLLRDEVESNAGLAVATVLDKITNGATLVDPLAYLAKAALNEMTNACRDERRQRREQFPDDSGPDQVADHLFYRADEESDLLEKFRDDPEIREIVASVQAGRSPQEIAADLSISQKTLTRKLKRAARTPPA